MESLGLYIHIPFCVHKCAYCDFYSLTDTGLVGKYIAALITQIKSFRKKAKKYTVDSVYIGGGTPSSISAEYICDVMLAVKDTFRLSPTAEITIEANPGTLDATKLSVYKSVGINRLSIGLQSADNDELASLSRIHTWEDFEKSFLLARLEGFDNISVDLMYALPGQHRSTLAKTLETVMDLGPEHISLYGLKIEENTPFGRDPDIQNSLPDEEKQYKMYMASAKTLEDHGYMQYEISNFAKPGYECKHNMKYWRCENYLGFGPAAASLFDGVLFNYMKNIALFTDDPLTPLLVESSEILTEREMATQYVMLGMRLTEGVGREVFRERFGLDLDLEYGQKLAPFIEKKLAEKTEYGYRLTRRGMLVSNYILSDILDL